MKEKVTIWESWNHKEKKWTHNHIESGWVDIEVDSPTPKCKAQNGWKSGKWRKSVGWLIDGVVR